MNNKTRALLVIAALLAAQLACNMPGPGGGTPQVPAPNQTLTALFAVTIVPETATVTLPPVITATSAGGAANPTATTASNSNAGAPTNTSVPPTATKQVVQASATPKASATIPGTRPRAAIVAKYITTPLAIDGDWSEWKDITTEYPANNVVFGKNNWTNADDLSASYHIGWDATYLYIAVKVRDDKYVQNASGANIYKGDSIEILMDTKLKDDYYYNQLSPDDFQLGISPGRPDPDGTREAYLWFPSNIAGARTNIKIGSRLENGIYRVEAAIPWTVFETTPVAGAHYGFVISVSDNDDSGSNTQQSMVSNDPNRSLTDPTTWGDLQLTK